MNELEKKFSCLCGSEVKETNRKAHEKTKKHTNYQQTHGTSNLMPVHNLPVPKAVRKLQTKRKYDEVEDDDYEDDDQGDDQQHDEGNDAYADGVEDDGFEEELFQAIQAIHQEVESLVADKVNLRNDLRLNIHKTVTEVGFLLNPLLHSINDRLKCIEDKLTSTPPEQPKWINDKCTQRN